jgi:hypothetical protein
MPLFISLLAADDDDGGVMRELAHNNVHPKCNKLSEKSHVTKQKNSHKIVIR